MDVSLWLLGLAAFLVGLSKGGLPAIGTLAVPVLSLAISPMRAAVLLLPIYLISDWVGIWLYRRQFSRPNLAILVPAGVAGVAIGWATVSVIPEKAVGLLVGLVGVGFCLSMWFRAPAGSPARSPNKVKGAFWGTLSGFTSFLSHAGGPPYQIYMLSQKLPKLEFAGTTVMTFAVINAAKILPYQSLRPYTGNDFETAAALLPFALAGTTVGAFLTKRIDDAWFVRLVQISLFVVSVKLIYGSVAGQ